MPVIETTKRVLDEKMKDMGKSNPLPAVAVAGTVAKKGAQGGMAVARKVTPVVAEAGRDIAEFGIEGVKSIGSKFGSWLSGNPPGVIQALMERFSIKKVADGEYTIHDKLHDWDVTLMSGFSQEKLEQALYKVVNACLYQTDWYLPDKIKDEVSSYSDPWKKEKEWRQKLGLTTKRNPDGDRYDEYQFPELAQNPPDKNVPQYINKATSIEGSQMEQNPPSRAWVVKFRNGETRQVNMPKGEVPDDDDFIRHNPKDPMVGQEIIDISPADGKCWNCAGAGCEICQAPDPVAIPNPVPVTVVGKNGTKVENPVVNVVNPPQDVYAFVVDPFFRPEIKANPPPKAETPKPNPPTDVPEVKTNPPTSVWDKPIMKIGGWKTNLLSVKTPEKALKVCKLFDGIWNSGLTITQRKNGLQAVRKRIRYLRKNKNLFAKAEETIKILEGWLNDHALTRENPQVKTMQAEQVVVGQTAVVDTPPTPTVVVNPPQESVPPTETPQAETPKVEEPKVEDVPKTVDEPKAEQPPVENKQENPPTPAPEVPKGCQHDLKFVGKANPKAGGQTVDVFRCEKCGKTYTKGV